MKNEPSWFSAIKGKTLEVGMCMERFSNLDLRLAVKNILHRTNLKYNLR